jgi:hypothetical protein
MRLQSILYHARNAGFVPGASVVSIETATTPSVNAVPVSLFNDDIWEKETLEVIKKFKTFYPSDVRILCSNKPTSDMSYGPLYCRLLREGKIKPTGNRRNSRIGNRRGGMENEYYSLF